MIKYAFRTTSDQLNKVYDIEHPREQQLKRIIYKLVPGSVIVFEDYRVDYQLLQEIVRELGPEYTLARDRLPGMERTFVWRYL